MSQPVRAVVWSVLVAGCALPLFIVMWPTLDAGSRVGAAVGVAAGMIAINVIDVRLRRRGTETGSLMIAAAAFMALECAGVAAFSRWFLFFLFAPAVNLASQLPDVLIDNGEFLPGLIMTLACGGEALACAFGLRELGRAIQRRAPFVSARFKARDA
jgi:hypothetical protein